MSSDEEYDDVVYPTMEEVKIVVRSPALARDDESEDSEDQQDQQSDNNEESEEEEEEYLDSEESEEDESLTVDEKLEREKQKVKQAQETISGLLNNIKEYRKLVEEEKSQFQVERQAERDAYARDRAKLKDFIATLEKDKEEITEIAEDYEKQLKDLEDDKNRRNRETMENLQTLLKEMTYIEEVNDTITKQLDEERENTSTMAQKLSTSTQLIEQLELKIKRQDEQIKKLQTEQAKAGPVTDQKAIAAIASLKDVEEDTLVREIIQLRQQLQIEKQKLEDIDALLGKARVLSGGNRSGEDAQQSTEQLRAEKEHHDQTKKQLQEEKQKATSSKEQIDKLQKRIKDLLQSHTNTLKELEEERSSHKQTVDKLSGLETQIKQQDPKDAKKFLFKKKDEKPKKEEKIKTTGSNTPSPRASLAPKEEVKPDEVGRKDSFSIINKEISDKLKEKEQKEGEMAPVDGVRSWRLKAKNMAYSNPTDLKRRYSVSSKMALAEAEVNKDPETPQNLTPESTPVVESQQRNRGQTWTKTTTPPVPVTAQPTATVAIKTPKSPKSRVAAHTLTWSRSKSPTSPNSSFSDLPVSPKDTKSSAIFSSTSSSGVSTPKEAMSPITSGTFSPVASPPVAIRDSDTASIENIPAMNRTGTMSRTRSRAGSLFRERRASISLRGPVVLLDDDSNGLPPGWEEIADENGKKMYIDHTTMTITYKHPIFSQSSKTEGKKAVMQIFTMLGTPTDLNIDKKSESKVLKCQAVVRGWICRRNFRELMKFFGTKTAAAKQLLQEERKYVDSLEHVVKDYLRPCREKNLLKSKTIKTIFFSIDSILDCNKIILELMEKRIGQQWNFHQKLGDAFLKSFIPSLQMYIDYAENYQNSVAAISSSKFASIVTKLSKKNEMKTGLSLAIDLPALLVLPVERLQKYKAGIETMLKYSFKTHPDYHNLTNSLQKISSALNKINDTKKYHDNEENLKRLSKVLVGNVPELNIPGRFFIREGTLVKLCRKIPKKRYFILFNDILIYGSKEDNSTKIKFHRLINLTEGSTIEDIPDSKSATPNGFKLITSTKSFVVYAESAESKKSWVETFNQVLAKINGGKRDKKGELAPVWVNDNEAVNCMLCDAQFTVLKRRHHCRRCGKVVCGACSENKSKLPNQGSVRVCDDCYEELGGKRKNTAAYRKRMSVRSDSVVVRPQKNVDIKSLSERLLREIFSYLDISDLLAVLRVSNQWSRVANQEKVWRSMFLQRWQQPDLIHEKTWRERYRIELNWESGKYHSVQTLKGHTSAISCVQFEGNYILSGSVDTKINIWDRSTQKVVRTLAGHTNTIRCMYLSIPKGIVISGSEDKTVKVWNWDTGSVTKSLREHTGEVTCLQYDPDKSILITGSGDKTVKIWDTKTWKVVNTLKSKDKVLSLQSFGNMLVTGGQDKSVRLWDINTGKCMNTLQGHTDAVKSVQFDENQIVAGYDDSVKIYDLLEGERVIRAHPDAKLTCLQFDKNKLVTGASDSTIKIWNPATGDILSTLDAKGSGWVRCLQFAQETLITGHGDNSLKIWSFFAPQ